MSLSYEDWKKYRDQYNMHGANDAADIWKRIQMSMVPGIDSQLNYASSLVPQQQALLNQLLSNLSPAGMQSAATRQKNSIYEGAARAANQAAMSAKGMGLGDGAQGGMVAGLYNGARRQAAQVDEQFNDPTYRNQLIGQGLGLVNQGMQPNLLNLLLSGQGVIDNQNQFNEQTKNKGIWGYAAPVLGEFAGANPELFKIRKR